MSDRTGLKTTPCILKSYAIVDSVSNPKRRASGNHPALERPLKAPEGKSVSTSTHIDLHKEFREFAEWAEDIMGTQRKDIDRIDGVLGRIENDMQLFKDFMADMRKQLDPHDRFMNVTNNQEISHLRDELAGLQLQMNQAIQSGPGLTRNGYEVLNQNMVRIDRKVIEISSLRPEVKSIMTRVDRLEERTRAALHSTNAQNASRAEESLRPGPTRAQSAKMLAQNIQSNSQKSSQPGTTQGHTAYELARDIPLDEGPVVDEPSREQAALQLAGELHQYGQTAVAKQIIARNLGKRNRSELSIPKQVKPATKRYRRETSLPRTERSSMGELHFLPPGSPSPENMSPGNMHASRAYAYKEGGPGSISFEELYSGNRLPSQSLGAEPRRARGRPKDTTSGQSLKNRTSDGVLLTDSGKIDGRSLRGRKTRPDGVRSETKKNQRPTGRLFEDEHEEISSSTRKVFHNSVTGMAKVLPSIEDEHSEEEGRRLRLRARELLAKETLDRYV